MFYEISRGPFHGHFKGSWHAAEGSAPHGSRAHGSGGHGRGGGGAGRRGERRGRGAEEAAGERGRPFAHRSFGRGGGGGRIFGPGDLRLVLLALIEDKPRHGYELIKELETKFGGGYAPSPGSVYPTLTLLEELGHIRAVHSEGARRLFEITSDGRRHLRENAAALNSAMARMEMAARAVAGEAPPQDLHHAMHTLKAALLFHRGGWSDKEIERVRKIIEAAAEAIAKISDRE
jgi:DNA-binding PadR family transcriptional regulator